MKTLLTALTLLTSSVFAQTAEKSPLTISLGAMSNYMARGTTQSQGNPTVYLNPEYIFPNKMYLGGFVSNMDFGDGTDTEYDFFLGYRFEINKWNMDIAINSFNYLNAPVNYNMQEIKLGWSRSITNSLTFTGNTSFTHDYFNISGPSTWVELGLSYAITPKWTLSGSAGNQWIIQDWGTYNTVNIGISYQINSHASIDFRYWNTDRADLGKYYFNAFATVLRITL